MPIPTVLTCEMTPNEYENNKDALRNIVSRVTRLRHGRMDIKRKDNENGERVVQVLSTHPDFVTSEMKKIFKE